MNWLACHTRRFAWAYVPLYALIVLVFCLKVVTVISVVDALILTAFCVVVTYSELLRWTC